MNSPIEQSKGNLGQDRITTSDLDSYKIKESSSSQSSATRTETMEKVNKVQTKLNKDAKAFKDMRLEIEEKKIDLSKITFTPKDPEKDSKFSRVIENQYNQSRFIYNTTYFMKFFIYWKIDQNYGTVSSFYKVDSSYETTDYETWYSQGHYSVSNSQSCEKYLNPTEGVNHHISDNYENEKAFYEILTEEIELYTSEIEDQVELINDYRNEIKYRLDKVVSMTFSKLYPNVDAYIYGSVSTGLMLPESDMDIVVIGVSSFGLRDSHIANITALYDNILKHISSKVLIKSMKIVQTQVPIIKLTFSLVELYNECESTDENELPFVDFNSVSSQLKELSVDISIWDSYNTTEHQGIKAAYYVQDCLEENPVLKPVLLVLK